mgnify:CR=1 FL=1
MLSNHWRFIIWAMSMSFLWINIVGRCILLLLLGCNLNLLGLKLLLNYLLLSYIFLLLLNVHIIFRTCSLLLGIGNQQIMRIRAANWVYRPTIHRSDYPSPTIWHWLLPLVLSIMAISSILIVSRMSLSATVLARSWSYNNILNIIIYWKINGWFWHLQFFLCTNQWWFDRLRCCLRTAHQVPNLWCMVHSRMVISLRKITVWLLCYVIPLTNCWTCLCVSGHCVPSLFWMSSVFAWSQSTWSRTRWTRKWLVYSYQLIN